MTKLNVKGTEMTILSVNNEDHTSLTDMLKAKEWRENNKNKKGNIRDYANISQLVCLSNLENLNAHFINENMKQPIRLEKLNKIAISQMRLLSEEHTTKLLGTKND